MLNKTISVILNIILILFLLIGLLTAFSLLPVRNNYRILSVMSGSMEPKIKTGSLIVVKPAGEYNVGDIISFKDINSNDGKTIVTHRISNETEKNGAIEFTTKGDANNASDSVPVRKEAVIGNSVLTMPYLGYLISCIKTLPGLIIIIVIPATIIIYEEIRKIKAEAKNIIEKRRAKRAKGRGGETWDKEF